MAVSTIPAELAHLVNLAADATGTFVVSATDDYFAPKENLLKSGPAEWKEGEYTDRGKWMDGWESMRKREPGHDHCVIRLGTPGIIHAIVADTTHFKGNAPEAVSLEITSVSHEATAQDLERATWTEVLPRTAVQPHTVNTIALPAKSAAATHVRLHIYPDGGVARLRVMGEVVPAPRTFWRESAVDLCAVGNGGTIERASDQFFGPPSNLLLPGRGTNMGDGWETKRRRTPGSDWCVIALGRRGVIDRVELDTHFFKGNAPQAVLVEAVDARGLAPAERERLFAGGDGWPVLIGKTALVQHRNHVIDVDRPMIATHLRVHIFPHGGVNRLRAVGHAVDTDAEQAKLTQLQQLADGDARDLLASFNGSRAWGELMVAVRQVSSVRALFAAADAAWWALDQKDWLEAFAAHPRIGDTHKAQTQTERSATWSQQEQRGVESAPEDTRARLAAQNTAYFDKFGFIFIVFASGKTPEQMLALLEARIGNTRAQEIENAAREQAKITRRRLEKWIEGA